MKTILVDDEFWGIQQFIQECKEHSYVELVGCFERPEQALEFAKTHKIELALLDIQMPTMDGITLGMQLRKLYPDLVIIYITGYDQYIKDAMLKVKADYYLMKPYTRQDMDEVLARAFHLSYRQKKRVVIRAFGSFDLFIDGTIIPFTNAKAKELLALCVDAKGGIVTMEKAITYLWEDRTYDNNVKSLYRKAVIYLTALFKSYEMEHIFIKGRGYCSINKQEVECDYFEYLEKKAISSDHTEMIQEYMNEYSWGEETLAKLYGPVER